MIKSVRIYLYKSICQIGLNIFAKSAGQSNQNIIIYFSKSIGENLLVQIRRLNWSELTCPNPSSKSARIYLSKSAGQIGQNILGQIRREIG